MKVLIPSLGCHSGLSLTLESYRFLCPEVQVIVVCGTQKKKDRLFLEKTKKRFPWVTFIFFNENYGFPGNINRGLREIDPKEDVVISNDDVVVLRPNLESRMLNIIRDCGNDVGAVGAVSNYVLSHQLYTHGGSGVQEVPVLSFFWVYLTSRARQLVGGLDEDYGLGLSDDLDWCYRARKKGFKLLLDRETLIWHHGSQTFLALENNGDLLMTYGERDEANRNLLIKKHPEISENIKE